MEFLSSLAAFFERYSPVDLAIIFENYDRFLHGVVVTLQLTFFSLAIGTLIAFPLAIARAHRHPIFNLPVYAYTYVFRGTPLLVQTYLIYFGLGQFAFVRESVLWEPVLSNAWWCALIAFTLNTAAYTTELLRGAIVSVPRGEVEAAKACGLSGRQQMRRIVLPAAFRRMLPAYSNEVIFLLHSSAVASTITLQDILGVGRWLNGRYYLAYEGFVAAAVLYLILAFAVNRGFKAWEGRWLVHLRPRESGETSKTSKLVPSRW